MAALNFDANTVAPSEAFSPIPAGDYNMVISHSEMKPTKDGQGWYLELKLTVLDGPHKGRTIFDRLNLGNSNETAVKIAQQTLSAICHATGVLQVADSGQLHDKPMKVAVKVKPGTTDYPDPKNEIKGYGAYTGASAVSAPAFAPVQPPVAATVPPAAPPVFVPQAAPPVAPPPVAPVAPPAPPVPATVAGAPTPPWMHRG